MKAQWEETKDDLRTLNHIYSEAKAQIHETLENLRQVQLERDEKENLVQKHVRTEKKLSSEALQLLSTAEETTAHLDKLYVKLERKK